MRIHSVAGVLPPERPLITRRPFRAPHHSASTAAIVGGSAGRGRVRQVSRTEASCSWTSCRSFSALRSRRSASRSRTASSRSHGCRARRSFPARFQLVATMNLCPCAGRGDPSAECSCSPQRLAAFRDKLSRALLDRFDLVVTVPRPRAAESAAGPPSARHPSGRVSPTGAPGSTAPRSGVPQKPTSCSAGRSSGCRSRVVAVPASRVARTQPPSPAPTLCFPTTSPKRSHTARRRSSLRERARARCLRGRQ